MNDPHREVGVAAFAASDDPAGDDAGLLRRIVGGDQDAMASFYREHSRVVFAQVLLVVGERVLAEEIVQDTMLAVWRSAGAFPWRVVSAFLGGSPSLGDGAGMAGPPAAGRG